MGNRADPSPRRTHSLFQEPDREGVSVGLPVADLYCGQHHADDPGDEHDGEDEESDQRKAEQDRNPSVDGVGNLEIQDFLPRGINLGAVSSLDQPDGQGCEDMHQRPSQQDAAEARKMKADAPRAR